MAFKPIRADGYGIWVCDQCREVTAIGYRGLERDAMISSLKQGILTWNNYTFCTYSCMDSFKRRYARNPSRFEARRSQGKAP